MGATLRCGAQASHCGGFSWCGAWALRAQASAAVVHGLQWHVGSSRTRDRTCVHCIGRRILNHCTTREVPVNWFLFLKYIPKSEIAGSYGNSMFNFLKNCQTVSQGGYAILHSHQQCKRVPISPHPHQHSLLSFFLFIANLVVMMCYIAEVLICISLMTKDLSIYFMYLLAICISSLEKCLFRSFAHLLIGFFIFL